MVVDDPSVHLPSVETLVAERGIAVDNNDLPGTANGVSRGGRISIRAGLSPAEEFAVIVHEPARDLLHPR